jgi:flagellar hook-associated protein 3 FlgL
MRITNKIMANNINSSIQDNLSRVARTQEQLSTSKSMLRPSDKPGNLGPLMGVKSSLSFLEQYERNLDDGLSYLDMGDSSMQTLGDMLNQAGELAIQGANGTYSPGDMAALGEQVDKMIDQVVDLANSSVGGRYIYAGAKNNLPPFKREGDKIVYNGDLNGLYREVLSGEDYRIDAPGITTGVSVSPVNVFSSIVPKIVSRPDDLTKSGVLELTLPDIVVSQTKLDGATYAELVSAGGVDSSTPGIVRITSGEFAGLELDITGYDPAETYTYKIVVDNELGVFGNGVETAPGSGEYVVYDPTTLGKDNFNKGIFDALFNLRNNLNSGDSFSTNLSVGEIQEKTDQLLQRRVGVGSRTRHFEALRNQLLDLEVKMRDVEQKLEGADMYKLSIDMSQEKTTFEASLSSGATMLNVSLLNFLK